MTTNDSKAALNNALSLENMNIDALIEKACELLQVWAPEQSRYKVTTDVDVRTIRYYVSKGLLPKPTHYEKGRAQYNGEHLIRIVYIKKCQSEHQTLRQIQGQLKKFSDHDVIAALTSDTPTITAQEKEKHVGDYQGLSLPGGSQLFMSTEHMKNEEDRLQLARALEELAQQLRKDS